MSVPAPRGLARLPEELVDLVCSFVRLFDAPSLIRTLCSLTLTSRRFLDPARRALLADPTWIFHTRKYDDDDVAVSAHQLLNYLVKQPEMGAHVQCLDYLSLLHWRLAHDFGHDLAFDNWALSLLRLCPNLVGVMVWPTLDFAWAEELARLPRLHRVYIMPRHESDWYEHDAVVFHAFLATLPMSRIEKLSFDTYKPPPAPPLSAPPRPVHLAGLRLELDACEVKSWARAGLDVDELRALVISYADYDVSAVGADLVLPAKLEQFVLQPEWDGHPVGSSCLNRFFSDWVQLFSDAAQCPILREVTLRSVPVDAASFAKVCAAAPNVVQLNMRNSRWRADSAAAAAALDGTISRAIASLARLRWLHLGEVPGGEAVLERTREWCERAGVTLVWQSVPLRARRQARVRARARRAETGRGGRSARAAAR
ncbi:hypothetical protein JCM9279_000281 [Rhodotorula babjevae]